MAVRRIIHEEMCKRLNPYGCEPIKLIVGGATLWKTGWGGLFTLWREEDGFYDEWQYFHVLANVIAKTMPPDWKDHNAKGRPKN